MTDQDTFHEIADAVHRLRRAFIRAGMKAPASIELGSIEDKDRFLHAMPRDLVLAQPHLDKPHPEWVANIMGMEVRMPGQWRVNSNGGRGLV